MKLAVIYDSVSGNTKQAAEWISEGMKRVKGTEAKAFSIHDVEEAFRAVEGDAIDDDGGLIEIAKDTPFVFCPPNTNCHGGRVSFDAVILGIVVPNHFV